MITEPSHFSKKMLTLSCVWSRVGSIDIENAFVIQTKYETTTFSILLAVPLRSKSIYFCTQSKLRMISEKNDKTYTITYYIKMKKQLDIYSWHSCRFSFILGKIKIVIKIKRKRLVKLPDPTSAPRRNQRSNSNNNKSITYTYWKNKGNYTRRYSPTVSI